MSKQGPRSISFRYTLSWEILPVIFGMHRRH